MSFAEQKTKPPNSALSLSLDLNKRKNLNNGRRKYTEFPKLSWAGNNIFAGASLGIEQIPQVWLVRDLHGPGPPLALPINKGAAASSPSHRPPE